MNGLFTAACLWSFSGVAVLNQGRKNHDRQYEACRRAQQTSQQGARPQTGSQRSKKKHVDRNEPEERQRIADTIPKIPKFHCHCTGDSNRRCCAKPAEKGFCRKLFGRRF